MHGIPFPHSKLIEKKKKTIEMAQNLEFPLWVPNREPGAEKMAQWLRVLAALPGTYSV